MTAHLQANLDNTCFRIISHVFNVATVVLYSRADARVQQFLDHLNRFAVSWKNSGVPTQDSIE
jgi:hypothetical protein